MKTLIDVVRLLMTTPRGHLLSPVVPFLLRQRIRRPSPPRKRIRPLILESYAALLWPMAGCLLPPAIPIFCTGLMLIGSIVVRRYRPSNRHHALDGASRGLDYTRLD